VAFAFPAITRVERVDTHKGKIFSHYDYKQQEFLDFVLEQYIKEGVEELSAEKLSGLIELKYHNVNDAVAELGEPANIREVFIGFQKYLYA
jgi:type I restriction enzyme R subunit